MITAIAIGYWATLFIGVAAALTFATLAWSAQSHRMIVASAISLTVSLIIAALPHPDGAPILTVLLTLSAISLAVIGGGPAATATLRLATRGTVPDGPHGGIMVAPAPDREVLRGGLTIGLLERFSAAATLIAGIPAAFALIIAIKGVGRFTELDAAEARERFIIGTFVSLIWAGASSALVILAVGWA